MRVFVVAAALLALVRADVPADLITEPLPELSPQPTFKQYSGYVKVNPGRHLHYWFVESENDPKNDPVVLWLNGGPGCSSLGGFFQEQGPFHFVNDSASDGLYYNPQRWNRIANVIFLESPVGVGFSYCESGVDCSSDDNSTAEENFNFVNTFFTTMFPEYASSEFFISGESYAGIYVPTLATRILKGNAGGESKINLKGIAVGNGCIGSEVGSCSQQGVGISVEFLYGHGLYSQNLYAQIKAQCPDLVNLAADAPPLSDDCQALLNQMSDEVGGVNIYDVYAPCVQSDAAAEHPVWRTPLRPMGAATALHHSVDRMLKERQGMVGLRGEAALGGPVGCIDGGAPATYLDRADVRKAIHYREGTVSSWSECSDINYSSTIPSLLPTYPNLIENIRVLIYSGDVDACVPYYGTEQWVYSLNRTITKEWHPWDQNGQVAGYAVEFEDNFKYITVLGAGHMVPQFKPEAAFLMFQKFLKGSDF
eukprot:CAMPEP_0196780386 /NCGR_PEP_ID=MMETSP1104-20130614/7771_1 /TAXON_ID=33652 /ORGANISM="Cafeteria sp., Strain Caron Lab Isolate" /LENGTH=479 /DNA_ID=CAMNT_0042150585 /DNA_START=9 /DNA_END=1448 /DNA_ORIENTATION=+